MAQRVVRGIALLFHDRGTRRGWVVSSTPRLFFTTGKNPVPIVQEAGWAPGPVWTGGKSRLHRDSIPDRPARIQSLYRLSYRAHNPVLYDNIIGPPSYMRSVVNRKVVMRRISVYSCPLSHCVNMHWQNYYRVLISVCVVPTWFSLLVCLFTRITVPHSSLPVTIIVQHDVIVIT